MNAYWKECGMTPFFGGWVFVYLFFYLIFFVTSITRDYHSRLYDIINTKFISSMRDPSELRFNNYFVVTTRRY